MDAQQSENEVNEGDDQIPAWWAQQKKELSDRIDKMEQMGSENNAYLEQILRIVKGKIPDGEESTPMRERTCLE
ncbi:hypothetical protein V6N12_037214 [Hibiscus sabdariffa]|uniref:Uncharacterized protein n=1 Tax=Hibiscus sabdariffa TaxID=183260 RepID=A0ABR2C389_9ROSI